MAGSRLIVEIAGNRDFTGVGIDGEHAAGIVIEAVGDRVAVCIVASAVTPTLAPTEAFSLTWFAEASLSETAPTASSVSPEVTSATLMAISAVEEEPSAEVARTVTVWLVAVS